MSIVPFLYSIKELVTPRLLRISWQNRLRRTTMKWRDLTLQDYLSYAQDVDPLTPETMQEHLMGDTCDVMTMEQCDPPVVTLFRNAFRRQDWTHAPGPFGRMLAFVTIHELAHAATLDDHYSDDWADACKMMGIAEERFDKKRLAGRFQFRDPVIWKAIEALPTYPGLVYQDGD